MKRLAGVRASYNFLDTPLTLLLLDAREIPEIFQKRAYGCLDEFASSSLAYTDSVSVVVMTYAPLEGDATIRELRSPAGGGWSVRHVVIHELSQVCLGAIYTCLVDSRYDKPNSFPSAIRFI